MPPSSSFDLVDAFERDLRAHADAMYSLVRGLTRNEGEVGDILQEASLRAWRAYDRLSHRENLRSWFLRIAYTSFIDATRRDRRNGYEHVELDERVLDQIALEPEPWEPELIRQSMDDSVVAALDSLPSEWQVVIRLVDVEGLAYEEAASMLDIPIGTVRSRLHRARKRVYSQLSSDEASGRRAFEKGGRES